MKFLNKIDLNLILILPLAVLCIQWLFDGKYLAFILSLINFLHCYFKISFKINNFFQAKSAKPWRVYHSQQQSARRTTLTAADNDRILRQQKKAYQDDTSKDKIVILDW